MNLSEKTPDYGPWNPGIKSRLPREYLPLSTVYRCENVFTTVAEAEELSDFSGLTAESLVVFRPDRLIVHELMIQITANISVPDGTSYGDLGVNFRDIASTILESYIQPHRDALHAHYEAARRNINDFVAQELRHHFNPGQESAPVAKNSGSWLSKLGWNNTGDARRDQSRPAEPPEHRAIADWTSKISATTSEVERSCCRALIAAVTAIANKHGRLPGNQDIVAKIAASLACNDFGSATIGEAITPYVELAAEREGYRLLPSQQSALVMNVKGASASGKSTLRPLQRRLAQRLDVPWEDFALISPDIWRKFLLDYDSLGDAYKYAGTLTGYEIEIIDRKLDTFMENKAARSEISHLLIDRFRFDSFASNPAGKDAGRLLTRFGDLVYMFFVITPPEATVERAWKRGRQFGRYKAVDDLLDHNVEAFTGMPQLFFRWALGTGKRVHYEFLDNSVPKGTPPRTIAFGWNDEMTVLDVKGLIDIDRFRKVDINAKTPSGVYSNVDLAPQANVAFLRQCVEKIPIINFADHATGRSYARVKGGKFVWIDNAYIDGMGSEEDALAGLKAVGLGNAATSESDPSLETRTASKSIHTLGQWGPSTADAGQSP